MAGLESGDLVGGRLEASKRISIGWEDCGVGVWVSSQVVHIHVEHGDVDEATILSMEVQLGGPVIALVVLD